MAKTSFCAAKSLQDKSFEEIVKFPNHSSFRIWVNDVSDNYMLHWHSVMEIIVPIENVYSANVHDSFFQIMPGEILIIPPGMLHELTAPPSGKRLFYMFDLSVFRTLKSYESIQSLLARPIHITPSSYPSIYEDMYSLLMQMQLAFQQRQEYHELKIYSLLLDFFARLCCQHSHMQNLFPNVRPAKQKEYVQKFNLLLKNMEEHYMDELDLSVLAESVGFSKFHFLRLFKQYTGTTPNEYIALYRIRVAEKLLCRSEYSIADIAALSGFTSLSTFNRLFRQYKKCSPSEYRQHNTAL